MKNEKQSICGFYSSIEEAQKQMDYNLKHRSEGDYSTFSIGKTQDGRMFTLICHINYSEELEKELENLFN